MFCVCLHLCVRRKPVVRMPTISRSPQIYCRSVACPAIGCAAVVKLDALVMPDTPHAPIYWRCAPDREQAHSYRFRGVQSIQRRPKTVPDRAQIPSRTKINVGVSLLAMAVCLFRQCRLTRRIRQQAGSHRFCSAVGFCVRRPSICPQPRFPAPTPIHCRSVACPAIGCAAVVKLDALVMPDKPHAPIYWRCAPDREQAHSYRFRGVQSIQHRPKTVPDRAQIPSRTKINVGVSLLAKAVCLCHQYRLTRRIRQQAGSHRFSA